MTGQPQMQQSTASSWPWRPGNEFEFLDDGARFFARMLESIDAARAYVLLEMYLVNSGGIATRFIAALSQARSRGVRVCAMFDGFGALGLRRADRARLLAAGVELRFFNPLRLQNRLLNFRRDHRKLLLIDGRLAFVGGAGLADEFASGAAGEPPWRELMVQIAGPVVADWQSAFAATWRRCGDALSLAAQPPAAPRSDGAVGRLAVSEARQRSGLANDVIRRFEAARERVWVMSAYFVPSRRLRKALRRAARRGVDVRLLVPGERTDHPWVRQAARRFYGALLRNGVRIFEYQPRVLHAKMILCDDWVSIGSSNLDRWSLRWNLEANQEITDRRASDAAAALFVADFAVSMQLSRRYWRERARLDRLRERIAGALDRWLDRWRGP
jgi:phosphatidylserine/phosphatidylglycerophosphate/cardiolipin synthase-like enzyme